MHIVHTKRTVVSKITLSDAPFILQLVNSHDWKRYIGDRQVGSLDDAKRYLENGFLACYATNGFGYYLIRIQESIPIGICGFLKKPHLANPDFGFALLPEFHGQGLALEASQATLKYGICEFQLALVDAEVRADNERSIRLLERLEFHLIPQQSDDQQLLFRFNTGLTD